VLGLRNIVFVISVGCLLVTFMPSLVYALPVFLALLLGSLHNPSRSPSAHFVPEDGSPARVLLVTAHPDDEAFFFGPTLSALVRNQDDSRSTEIYSLCLSTGDADGLGTVRVHELAASLDVLGVKEGHRWVLDSEALKDDINKIWDAPSVADAVHPYVEAHNITTILTFDETGVSQHPNHFSIYYGAKQLLSYPNVSPNLRAYALVTVPLSIKYIGPIAPLQAKYDLVVASILGQVESSVPVFIAGTNHWWTTARALYAHRSQLIWFRWLYMAFSRYLWVNEWVPITRSD